MKLSEILNDWPKKLFHNFCPKTENVMEPCICGAEIANQVLHACDREIDMEALAKALYKEFFNAMSLENVDYVTHTIYLENAEKIISTMPTWLRKVSE